MASPRAAGFFLKVGKSRDQSVAQSILKCQRAVQKEMETPRRFGMNARATLNFG